MPEHTSIVSKVFFLSAGLHVLLRLQLGRCRTPPGMDSDPTSEGASNLRLTSGFFVLKSHTFSGKNCHAQKTLKEFSNQETRKMGEKCFEEIIWL